MNFQGMLDQIEKLLLEKTCEESIDSNDPKKIEICKIQFTKRKSM